jgi:uncharacterized phosphosugar-binding protein
MWAERFFDTVSERLAEVKAAERAAVEQAAEAIANCLAGDGLVYVFGSGHSAALAMDIFYRAGGLILIEPLFDERIILNHRPVTETTDWERKEGWTPALFASSGARPGDVIIVISTSGRNAAPVDVALAAKAAGLIVIAVTARCYAETLPPRHSSGKRLHEAADIVIDNHADPGDAAISLPGLGQKVGPTSTVLGSAILQALVVEAVALLLSRGLAPPVYMSSNLPGGDDHNQAVLARYRDRLRYLQGR